MGKKKLKVETLRYSVLDRKFEEIELPFKDFEEDIGFKVLELGKKRDIIESYAQLNKLELDARFVVIDPQEGSNKENRTHGMTIKSRYSKFRRYLIEGKKDCADAIATDFCNLLSDATNNEFRYIVKRDELKGEFGKIFQFPTNKTLIDGDDISVLAVIGYERNGSGLLLPLGFQREQGWLTAELKAYVKHINSFSER